MVLERPADRSGEGGAGGLQTRTFSQPSRPSAVFGNNKKEKYPESVRVGFGRDWCCRLGVHSLAHVTSQRGHLWCASGWGGGGAE